MIAKDMFTVFNQNGLLDPETARLGTAGPVLEPGGSKPAADLVADFLGRPYNFAAYRRMAQCELRNSLGTQELAN